MIEQIHAAGECLMSLRSIIFLDIGLLSRRIVNFAKIYIWALITGLNTDLGPKNVLPIANTRREQSTVFPLGSTIVIFETRGGLITLSPLTSALCKRASTGEG